MELHQLFESSSRGSCFQAVSAGGVLHIVDHADAVEVDDGGSLLGDICGEIAGQSGPVPVSVHADFLLVDN